MKAASNNLIALLSSSNRFVMYEVYTITLTDGTTLTWRNGDPLFASGQFNFQIVDLDAKINGGTSQAVGVTVSGLDASATYSVTLPAGLTHTGWSAWSSDSATGPGTPPPPGQYWGNGFVVNGGASGWSFGYVDGYPNGEAARAAFTGGTVAGHTSYTFWISDTNPSDNRGGLSILLSRL